LRNALFFSELYRTLERPGDYSLDKKEFASYLRVLQICDQSKASDKFIERQYAKMSGALGAALTLTSKETHRNRGSVKFWQLCEFVAREYCPGRRTRKRVLRMVSEKDKTLGRKVSRVVVGEESDSDEDDLPPFRRMEDFAAVERALNTLMTSPAAQDAMWEKLTGGAKEERVSFREVVGALSNRFAIFRERDGDALRRAYNWTVETDATIAKRSGASDLSGAEIDDHSAGSAMVKRSGFGPLLRNLVYFFQVYSLSDTVLLPNEGTGRLASGEASEGRLLSRNDVERLTSDATTLGLCLDAIKNPVWEELGAEGETVRLDAFCAWVAKHKSETFEKRQRRSRGGGEKSSKRVKRNSRGQVSNEEVAVAAAVVEKEMDDRGSGSRGSGRGRAPSGGDRRGRGSSEGRRGGRGRGRGGRKEERRGRGRGGRGGARGGARSGSRSPKKAGRGGRGGRGGAKGRGRKRK
jgi:hypothetical protein